ncbi:MAG: hypothetical protein WCX83_04530 [Candidatus Cloacimonas sp.]|jgi:hypothetical protein|nr:hypothetical protein [Candidatus Cloacimonadota bacterium]
MKKLMLLIMFAGLLAFGAIKPVHADDPYHGGSIQYPLITWDEIEGEYEVLGITQDGYLIIRYNGKIYIFEPRKKRNNV